MDLDPDLAGDANFEDPENAQAIVVPGWEISPDMEQDKWDAILEHPQIVFARTSPQQKLVIVENNQVCVCRASCVECCVCVGVVRFFFFYSCLLALGGPGARGRF